MRLRMVLAGEIKTLNKALAIKSDSLLLHLALAEKHELAGNVAGAKQVSPAPRLCPAARLCSWVARARGKGRCKWRCKGRQRVSQPNRPNS
jgi:hypothetical protein